MWCRLTRATPLSHNTPSLSLLFVIVTCLGIITTTIFIVTSFGITVINIIGPFAPSYHHAATRPSSPRRLSALANRRHQQLGGGFVCGRPAFGGLATVRDRRGCRRARRTVRDRSAAAADRLSHALDSVDSARPGPARRGAVWRGVARVVVAVASRHVQRR